MPLNYIKINSNEHNSATTVLHNWVFRTAKPSDVLNFSDLAWNVFQNEVLFLWNNLIHMFRIQLLGNQNTRNVKENRQNYVWKLQEVTQLCLAIWRNVAGVTKEWKRSQPTKVWVGEFVPQTHIYGTQCDREITTTSCVWPKRSHNQIWKNNRAFFTIRS